MEAAVAAAAGKETRTAVVAVGEAFQLRAVDIDFGSFALTQIAAAAAAVAETVA